MKQDGVRCKGYTIKLYQCQNLKNQILLLFENTFFSILTICNYKCYYLFFPTKLHNHSFQCNLFIQYQFVTHVISRPFTEKVQSDHTVSFQRKQADCVESMTLQDKLLLDEHVVTVDIRLHCVVDSIVIPLLIMNIVYHFNPKLL